MQETQLRSLGREDLLEKEMATTPVLLPGNPEAPGGLQSMGITEESGHLVTKKQQQPRYRSFVVEVN